MRRGHILFIDAYDSFSNNIITLLKDNLPVTVESIKIDDARFVLNDEAFFHFLDGFDAVVAGPGPGHPGDPKAVGLIGKLWDLPDEHVLPVLGICLGFQSLVLPLGANIERLNEPRHGMVTKITHRGFDIFAGLGDLVATQYHSLHARIQASEARDIDQEAIWTSTQTCSDLVPLAWDLSDVQNGPILMAARHRHKPFWGVQYHPESVCSSGGGELVLNWWSEVVKVRGSSAFRVDAFAPVKQPEGRMNTEPPTAEVQWLVLPLEDTIETIHIAELLHDGFGHQPFVLESGVRNGYPLNPETGRFSILGAQNADAIHIRYSTQDRILTTSIQGQMDLVQIATVQEAFQYLDYFAQQHKGRDGPPIVPFWGGLTGYTTYEAGLESIDVSPSCTPQAPRPDVWFVFVERSIVIDHADKQLYIQSIRGDDRPWLNSMRQRVQQFQSKAQRRMSFDRAWPSQLQTHAANVLRQPEKDDYCRKVKDCQKQLRAGESYELCLTDQTLVQSQVDSWHLYQRLRRLNPAPFSAYLRLSGEAGVGIDVVGSSPERFLSWDRKGKCQYRPIKGTVKKGAGMTPEKAKVILQSPKEQAENLMIVDLIRHDLSGGSGYAEAAYKCCVQL